MLPPRSHCGTGYGEKGMSAFFIRPHVLSFVITGYIGSTQDSETPRLRMLSSIPYTIKVSPRARYAKLRMSPHDGLVVVVPKGFDQREVPAIVESRRAWIEKVQGGFDRRRVDGVSDGTGLPSTLELAGIGESWLVDYLPQAGEKLLLRESGADRLLLSGAVNDEAGCRSAIESWLKRRAALRLLPQLERLASAYGFAFSSATVRKQHSRWGSCSSRGRVSLNLKLLFLPPLLVRYIMVHELCHTRHMNHSRRFWDEVANVDPDFSLHDREMRHAWRYVPGWLAMRE